MMTAAQEAASLRLALLRGGYLPIPLFGKEPPTYGQNNNRKGFKAWQNLTDISVKQIEMWSRIWPDATNTGVLTRTTPTLDADILLEPAAVAVEQLVREHYEQSGYVLTRIGQPPKRAFPFQTQEPFAKITINFVARNGTGTEKLEFLANGQQVVVAGIHPDTRKPYFWHGGEPGPIAREDLPYIREAEARELIERAAGLLVSEFGYVRAARETRAAPTLTLISIKKDHSHDAIRGGV